MQAAHQVNGLTLRKEFRRMRTTMSERLITGGYIKQRKKFYREHFNHNVDISTSPSKLLVQDDESDTKVDFDLFSLKISIQYVTNKHCLVQYWTFINQLPLAEGESK